MAKSPENHIDRQAAEWAARTEGTTLSVTDQAAFEAWLAADIRHVGAYSKATAVLAQFERVSTVGGMAEIVPPRDTFVPSRRQVLWAGSIAASIAAAVVVGGPAWDYLNEQTYVTSIGETKVVPLSDGSTITLNTDTKLVVRYSQSRRDIRLVHGEALFDVAKNKTRPFVVGAHDVNVRAVGTSFSVRMLSVEPLQVEVREGVVDLRRPATPVAAPVLVHANGRAIVAADAPIVVTQETPNRIARDLAWKAGRIAFEDQSLAQAAQEFSRYSETRIVIDDPAVAQRTVTGLFVSNDPVGFAKAVAVSLGLRAEVGQSAVRLTRKYK